MYCFKCGFEIQNDALFCSKCGVAQNINSHVGLSNDLIENNHYDREALRIYLTDVLNLECIKNKLDGARNSLNGEIQNMQAWNFYKYYEISGLKNKGFYFFYNGSDYFTLYRKWYNFYVINLCDSGGDWFVIDSKTESNLSKTSAYSDGNYLGFFDKFTARDAFINSFSHFKKTAPQSYREKQADIDKEFEKLNEIEKEFEIANKLLEKSYNINIIPQQFRNLYAVYYLCDFIKTSNESLSTALLHCDLDVIKQKLNQIIENQEEIIIHQAILEAQNEHILKQNQQALTHLANIEHNTDRAAQYSKMAANNAEACAWISLANYIKD